MTIPIERPATADGLFLWIMHRFAEEFREHAILKGDMAMRLIDSPRGTTDIDYVFVPFASKKDIRTQIESVLDELAQAEIHLTMHSNMLRAEIHLDDVAIQLEADVAMECESLVMSTGGFAQNLGHPARVVRVMSLDWALAHKLAAWNERRLMRDLYDCYFFVGRLGEWPNALELDRRLANVNSRLPRLRKIKSMSRIELAAALREVVSELEQAHLDAELGGLLPKEELAGLAPRMKASITKLVDWLEEIDDASA